MPVLTPGRRWQPPFSPFKREPLGRRMLARTERMVKGPLFGCRMCGNCLLQETAFICPMECPKGLRNGPCGGATESCYVDPTRPCIWYAIYERAFRMGREDMLMEVLPPLDWDQVGTETWGEVGQQIRKIGIGTVLSGVLNPTRRPQVWDAVFRPVRQPEWWDGDAQYHPPGYDDPVSEFEQRLAAGEFVVATELTPPLGIEVTSFRTSLENIGPHVTAINFTDGASAIPRMSSLACSKIALESGVEPVLQIAARDATRTGLQGQVIGASALGIRNILVISGDSPALAKPPRARLDWLDLDAVQMLWLLRKMRDEGTYLGGRAIPEPPSYFLGAAASPFASTPKIQAMREAKKVHAGAQFFQTNLVFDVDGLDAWLEELNRRDVLDKVSILAGVSPLRSMRTAIYLNEKLPGVHIPEHILRRLAGAGDDIERAGFDIALETIVALRDKLGIAGVHLMPIGWESAIPRLIVAAGLDRTITSTR